MSFLQCNSRYLYNMFVYKFSTMNYNNIKLWLWHTCILIHYHDKTDFLQNLVLVILNYLTICCVIGTYTDIAVLYHWIHCILQCLGIHNLNGYMMYVYFYVNNTYTMLFDTND